MKVTRRDIIKGAAATTSLIAVGCGNDVHPAPLVSDSDAEKYFAVSNEGVMNVNLDQLPPLQDVGGAGIIPVKAMSSAAVAGPFPPSVLAIRTEPNTFVAVNAECTHAGCPLGYASEDRQIECPCHASRFSAGYDGPVGAVLHAPAVQGPQVFAAELLSASRLKVTVVCSPGSQ